ncbi:hypothetical protein NQ315_000430 [Exocentrus adspersus]|uniref:Protein sleepless n=1 Tax=Exocentrus adspersus TaxID=1586481 RepID=A0AAV8VLS3_9CUCU|nr:hypothetical protein NQ315_000430 [Exocentrus adspersus]
MSTTRFFVCAIAVVVAFFTSEASALQCWKCSSDLDRACADPFNETEIRRGRGGTLYDNLQQNYNNRQNYDPNFNPPNYNPNFQGQTPTLEYCDENEASLRRMKNVCVKKTVRGNSYVSIIRRCALIGFNEEVTTCHDPVSRGLTLEFCEYCDRDGCNSAFGVKANVFLASLLALGLILFFRQ